MKKLFFNYYVIIIIIILYYYILWFIDDIPGIKLRYIKSILYDN